MSRQAAITVANGPKSLDTGVYTINLPCPRCGVIEEVLVSIKSQLTTPQDEIGKLAAKLKGRPVDHDCQQQRIPLEREQG